VARAPAKGSRTVRQSFRPRARLLTILGDQLIGSPRLAVFELVKNAWDADASQVTVTIEGLDEGEPTITVEDNGYGMTMEDIRNVWLVPADDHREQERLSGKRSPKFNRLPMGEKGVGRFAVHKLGDRIEMVTRAARRRECAVSIDWGTLVRNKLLDQAKVTIRERDPKVFVRSRTGTRITISKLREPHWTRRDLRELWRQLVSISSPIGSHGDNFEIRLEVPEREDWLKDLPDPTALLEQAPWRFEFKFDGDLIHYEYKFLGVPGVPIEPRAVTDDEKLQIMRELESDDLDPAEARKRRKTEKVVADTATLQGIGPVSGTFHIYDRDRNVLTQYPQSRLIERFLDQNGGVRVYRDDIRVYNYGEAEDDWLNLDLGRYNAPTRNISRNIVIGSVQLDLAASTELREKTNREGFVLNSAYRRLQQVVRGALTIAESERQKDKRRIRTWFGRDPEGPGGITKSIDQLRKLARKYKVSKELEPSIRRIESEYEELRETFLRSGMSNVGLAVVFHEVERGVAVLHRTIVAGGSIDQVRAQSGQLQAVLEQSTRLLRKNEREVHRLRDLVLAARDLMLVRFRHHKVTLDCPVLDDSANDTEAFFAFNLALGALTNLIDNAIYWLQVAWDEDDPGGRRAIYMNIADWDGHPAIIVADNGPGFKDEPSEVVQPFFSRRPDGMGLGLYYANIVMQLNEGWLEIPAHEDADVPDRFTGAAVVLVFSGEA
jgi:signal transduction histidine kinase